MVLVFFHFQGGMFGKKRALLAISPALTTKVTCSTFVFLRFGLQPRLFWQTEVTLCKTVFSEGNILLVLLSSCHDVMALPDLLSGLFWHTGEMVHVLHSSVMLPGAFGMIIFTITHIGCAGN